MPRPHEGAPHPGTIFTLIPLETSKHAVDATYDPANLGLVSITEYGRGIDVGTAVRSPTRQTLARLGTDTGRNCIRIKGFRVSRLHLTFEIHETSRCVLLYDRSPKNTTIIEHEPTVTHTVFPFETGRPRRVMVTPNINCVIGMGGEKANLVRFKLLWWNKEEFTVPHNPDLVVPDSSLARTCGSENPEVTRETRIHVTNKNRIRYVEQAESIGKGRFGVVYKALNVDTGDLMAVKVLSRQMTGTESWGDVQHAARKNEVETLERLRHVSCRSPLSLFTYRSTDSSSLAKYRRIFGLQRRDVPPGDFPQVERRVCQSSVH